MHTQHTYMHTQHTYMHTQHTYMHTQHTYIHTQHTYMHTQHTYMHTQHTYMHTQHTYMHTQHTYMHTQHTYMHTQPPTRRSNNGKRGLLLRKIQGLLVKRPDAAKHACHPTSFARQTFCSCAWQAFSSGLSFIPERACVRACVHVCVHASVPRYLRASVPAVCSCARQASGVRVCVCLCMRVYICVRVESECV